MGHANDRARACCLLAAMGLALPAAAQIDPLAEPFDQTFDWRELLPSQGGDGSLGYVLRNCETEWILSSFRPPLRAGDVNGDGRDDLLHDVDVDTGPIVFGYGVLMSGDNSLPVRDIGDPLANHGFQYRVTPIGAGPSSHLGDINGDGIDDVAAQQTRMTCSRGCYYYITTTIIFGRDEAASGPFDPINPVTPRLGVSSPLQNVYVSDRVGDVNGDGIDDLALRHSPRSASGALNIKAAVLFGRGASEPFPEFATPEQLRDTGGGVFIGTSDRSRELSGSVASAGDLNRDGQSDCILPTWNLASQPGTFVVFGRAAADPFPSELDLATAPEGDVVFFQSETERAVKSAGTIGDINGDGIDDIGIATATETFDHRLYIVFGRHDSHRDPFPPVVRLSDLDGSNGFKFDAAWEQLNGHSIRKLGDINGDGVDDLLLRDLIILGSDRQRFPAHANLAAFEPERIIRFNQELKPIGDVNGDGTPDLAASIDGTDCEVAAIIYGRRPPPPCPADLDRDGALTIYDWLTFTNAWEAQDPLADVDGDGAFSLLDFLVYQVWFAAGCP